MRKDWDILCAGDVNIDLIVPDFQGLPSPGEEAIVSDMTLCLGGGAALTAAGAGKLGMRTALYASSGDDPFGKSLRELLEHVGVDCSLMDYTPGTRTGITISLTDAADRRFLTYRGSGGNFSPDRLPPEYARRARHIHLTGYSSETHSVYMEMIRHLREEDHTLTFSLDPGWDATGNWSERIFEIAAELDVLFCNETEVLHYTGEISVEQAAQKLAAHSGNIAVVKCGGRGALACQGKEVAFVPAKEVRVVDTTGAGDSFNSGFLYGMLSGASLKRCLAYGVFCGTATVQDYGGNTVFPSEEELLRACREETI